MRTHVIIFILLVACTDKPQKTEISTEFSDKFLSFDSIQIEHWDTARKRGYPYNLVTSTYDTYLGLRFDYYVYKTDGQSFPYKKVLVSNDTVSYLLDFKEEYAISYYKISDSTLPEITIGNQLRELFNTLSLDKRLQIMVTYKILHEIMGMDFVRPYHREISLKQFETGVETSSIKKINAFYDALEQRGDILSPENFDLNPREYDIYNLDDYKCFYKINFKDSFYVECLFPEEYDIFLW